MGNRYRSWEELRQIIRSAIAESSPPEFSSFELTESEEIYFRAKAAKAVDRVARQASAFRETYQLPTEKTFWYVIGVIGAIVATAALAGGYLWMTDHIGSEFYPLYASCATLSVAAIGAGVAAWIAHRNAVRQNTNNTIFARFSQATFGDATQRFNTKFGFAPYPLVTTKWVKELRDSADEEERKAAAAVSYLLNYFEFIASGVLRGDLDAYVVRQNIRGMICHYHDKCLPLVRENNQANPRALENLIKIRTHYREP